jgi:ubiquinone biosynthesis protein
VGAVRGRSPQPQVARLLRVRLERLGGLFVKLGQFIAMRPDIASPAFVREAEHLLDAVRPFDGRIAVEIVERELKQPLSALFATFELVPIAAASFAQVHRATLRGGEAVAVKVQRPNLERQVTSDLSFMRFIVSIIELSGITRRLRLGDALDDFSHWTQEELDFCKEAAFAAALRESKVEIPHEYIPSIYWTHTTRRILTLEYLDGVWVSQMHAAINANDSAALAAWGERGIDRRQVAYQIFDNMMRQAFERGIFHGDPHAGNLIILDAQTIGYVDFGITGQIDRRFRDIELSVLMALSSGDLDAYFRSVIKFFYPLPSDANIEAIRRSIMQGARDWLNAFYNQRATLADRGTAGLLLNVLEVARRHNLAFSNVALRYFRAVMAIEATILVFDDEFPFRENINESLRGIQFRDIRRANTPDATSALLLGLASFAQTLPQLLTRGFTQLEEAGGWITASVNTFRSTLALCIRYVAQFLGVAAVASVVDIKFGFLPSWLPFNGSFLGPISFLIGSLLCAILSRRLYLSAMPIAD